MKYERVRGRRAKKGGKKKRESKMHGCRADDFNVVILSIERASSMTYLDYYHRYCSDDPDPQNILHCPSLPFSCSCMQGDSSLLQGDSFYVSRSFVGICLSLPRSLPPLLSSTLLYFSLHRHHQPCLCQKRIPHYKSSTDCTQRPMVS